MTLRSTIAAMVVLATSTVWAQSAPPVNMPAGVGPAGGMHAPMRRMGASAAAQGQAHTMLTMRQQMQDMEETLNKMHVLMKQMRAKTAASSSKDSLAKANLDMWELMLNHLDKQFEQLRVTTLMREDWESRRAAMYKQADAKAAADAASHARVPESAAPQAPAGGSSASGSDAAKSAPAAPSAVPITRNATPAQTPAQTTSPEPQK